MAQAEISEELCEIEKIMRFLLPLAETFARGGCFYCFVKPFIIPHSSVPASLSGKLPVGTRTHSGRKTAFFGSAAYFLTAMFFYATGLTRNVYAIYGLASLAMLLVICGTDRRNFRQKAFLVITFFSLSWFAAAMAEILYDILYDAAVKSDYMQNHPERSSALYIIMCVFDRVLDFALTMLGIRMVLKVYANKAAELEKKELAMLALPSLMSLTGYEIMRYYRVFYALEAGRMEKAYDSLTLLFCGMSSVTIIVMIMLYQDIKAKQDENRQAQLLSVQLADIRRHVEQAEGLYENIRGLRHDMANHLLILERLHEEDKTDAARAYSQEIKAELARNAGGAGSGNPVTDVILREFKKEAEELGISFHSEFFYPLEPNMNVFDISIVLNNALQNAIENTSEDAEGGKRISIVSYRRNNAYIIEICNSFSGNLQWNAKTGLPATSKPNCPLASGDTAPPGTRQISVQATPQSQHNRLDSSPAGINTGLHGYGLPNIRKVAQKYSGDIDITLKDGSFCLCIMLMLE